MSESTQLQKERNPVVDYLANKRPQLETILPKHITPEKFLRVVFVQMQRTPDLAQCTKESIYSSMMAAGERGLIPDGYHGHLIPFWKSDKKTGQRWRECQFIPDYKGIMLLARQSGDVADVFPASIREHDHFEYELGFNRKLVHRPNLLGNRGDIVAVYCVVELKDGAKTFGPGPMTVEEVERIRARSRSGQKGPWITDWEAMAWKTVIKRTLKFVAQSPELRSIIDLDDSQYSAEAQAAPAEVTIEGLMAEAGPAEAEPAQVSRETEPEKLAPASTQTAPFVPEGWPRKTENGLWCDSAGQLYDETRDGWNRRDNCPSVNSDGTFRARRGAAKPESRKEAAPAGNPAGQGQGEPGNSPAPGATQDDGGSSPPADSAGDNAQAKPHTVTPFNDRAKAAAGEIGSQEILEEIRKAETVERMDEIDDLIRELAQGMERAMCQTASGNKRRAIQASTGGLSNNRG